MPPNKAAGHASVVRSLYFKLLILLQICFIEHEKSNIHTRLKAILMLFFGHIGIAVGVVFLVLLVLKVQADYRIVILGSMLPDIIDKPLGIYIFTEALDSGRVFCHTLLFIVLLALASLVLYSKKRQIWLAFLTVGSAVHILLDQMWQWPNILYWPLFGLSFGHRASGRNYIVQIIQSSYNNMYVYETELIGIIILALFAVYYKLYMPDRLKAFILKGTLGTPIELPFLTSYAKYKPAKK